MRTIAGLALLLAILLSACAPKTARQAPADAGPTHEMLAQQGDAPPGAQAGHSPAAGSQSSTGASAGSAPSPGAWPFLLTSEETTFQVHEPIVDSWDSGILTARAVVVAQPPTPARSIPGSVAIKAAAELDSVAGIASLVDTEVLSVSFPVGVDKTQAWSEFLRFAVPPRITELPATALESGRGIAQARQSAAAAAVIAPRILVSEQPAMLVYIDGTPRYVPVKNTDLTGVLNTRVLLLKDAAGTFYLHLYDGWVQAASLDGPWQIAAGPRGTSELEQAAHASGRVNLLAGKADAAGNTPTLSAGPLPLILVATRPTALIVVDGAPRYDSVAGTNLLYAVNTSAHLYQDAASGDVYVRVDGSWFRAPNINGAWQHVPTANLPSDFSALPGNRPVRDGRDVVAADRRTATLSLNLDGDPVLEPIPGTDLNYVANASVPVIQIDIDNWYAVQNGVWFYSTEATGPWTVTSRIPPVIYSIPPGVPIYHAIHSRVLASSTDVTYYGYAGVGSHAGEGGAVGVEEQGSDYQYTPPSGMYWNWTY